MNRQWLAQDAEASQLRAAALSPRAQAAQRDGDTEAAKLLQLEARMWADRASYPLARLLDGQFLGRDDPDQPATTDRRGHVDRPA
jgi:hypothetical protein